MHIHLHLFPFCGHIGQRTKNIVREINEIKRGKENLQTRKDMFNKIFFDSKTAFQPMFWPKSLGKRKCYKPT